jgi:mono/diheme cytochrome c family protein
MIMTRNATIHTALAGALVAALGAAACSGGSKTTTPDPRRIARGEYLVTVGGCNDCHTPLKMGPNGPQPDMERLLSGHPEGFPISEGTMPASDRWMMTAAASGTAFAGPWGVSFTKNLTPDENTGLGIWSEEMFIKALRTGKHMGVSRDILPPMPWSNYGKMTDDDLKSVFAYLRSIKPIHNQVPEPIAPAPMRTAENRAPEGLPIGEH